MATAPSSVEYATARPVPVTVLGAAEALPRVGPAQVGSDNWTMSVRGLVTLGETVLVALAFPFIVLGLGLPIVLLVRLVLEAFRAIV